MLRVISNLKSWYALSRDYKGLLREKGLEKLKIFNSILRLCSGFSEASTVGENQEEATGGV